MKLKNTIPKISMKKKSIILSVITIIELLILMTTMTFSWFEALTSLEISGENLSTWAGVKSKFFIGEGSNYQSTAELNQYFDKQAKAKFSPVSSYDGENFYALSDGQASNYAEYLSGVENGTLKFRKLTNEEKNSSIVYFSFQVTADTSDTTFWLKSMPTVKVGGTALEDNNNPFRIRIDDGTGVAPSSGPGNQILTTRTTWPSGGKYATGASRNNMLALEGLNANRTGDLKESGDILGNRANYMVFNSSPTSINKNGGEKLFTVAKGTTKTITIAIWLEALDQSYSETLITPGKTVEINMEFCSSWDVTDTITFRDYTSEQWVDTKDSAGNTKKLGVINSDNKTSGAHYYELKYNNDHTWTGQIPRAVQNCKFLWENSSGYDSNPAGQWVTEARGTNTVFTAFGSTAGIWYNGDVTKISLSDYTSGSWVKNDGAKLKIQTIYNSVAMEYSMTDTPAADSYGKDTWYAYIPSSLNEVVFNRYAPNSSGVSTLYNYWNAPDRNGETIYRILDDGTLEETTGVIIYLQIPGSDFLYEGNMPAVSLTSTQNAAVIDALGSKPQNLLKANYKIKNGETGADEWPTNAYGNTYGSMTKISDTLYSFQFDELKAGTRLSFWNRTEYNWNDIAHATHFAPAMTYDGTNNMITLSGKTAMTDSQFQNCYIYSGSWSTYGTGAGTSTEAHQGYGVWGSVPALPTTGLTTHTFKHYDTNATAVTCTFDYKQTDGNTYTYSLNMTKGTNGWTVQVPSSVMTMAFSDGTNTWKDVTRTITGQRFFYPINDNICIPQTSNTFMRIYFTDNYSWGKVSFYCWNASNTGYVGWPGEAMTHIGTNNQNQKVYCYLLPANYKTGIIFNNNGGGKQTVDIKSGMTDMLGYYISGQDGNYTVGTWNVDTSFLNTYSK